MKENTRIEYLFNLISESTKAIRTKKLPNFDGKNFWQPIKDQLSIFDDQYIDSWIPLDKSTINSVMSLPEFDQNGKMIEINHFLIQQVRIPLSEKPNLRRIMQIALNIGQYSVHVEHNMYFDKSNLSDYISLNNWTILDNLITDDLLSEIKNYLENY
jgi:hypothetical protein